MNHRVRAPFLTFFPFLVGEMLILALSWKVCLRTCLTKGSLAICNATMYRAPSRTASGLGNWLKQTKKGNTESWDVRTQPDPLPCHICRTSVRIPTHWPTHIVLGQLQGLCRELLCLVTLVTVSEILSKLLRCQTKLFSQAIYGENKQTKHRIKKQKSHKWWEGYCSLHWAQLSALVLKVSHTTQNCMQARPQHTASSVWQSKALTQPSCLTDGVHIPTGSLLQLRPLLLIIFCILPFTYRKHMFSKASSHLQYISSTIKGTNTNYIVQHSP